MQDQTARSTGTLGCRQKIAQAVEQFVNLHHLWLFVVVFLRNRKTINRKRTKAKGAPLAVGIKGIVRSALHASFGYEDGIARNLIALNPMFEVGPIDVGRIEINAGSCCSPNIQIRRMRSATWILASPFQWRGKLCIHIHRKRIFAFTRTGHGIDIAGIAPSHECFICVISKHLAPILALLVEVC